MHIGLIALAAALVSSLLPTNAFAFPEMIRHGYGQCIACHYSPTGGGLLTGYGRTLSGEILSWKGVGKIKVKESESDFLWGLLPPSETYSLGGDVRAVQLLRDTPEFSEAKFIFMQGDLEAALNLGEKFTLVGMGGVTPTAMVGAQYEKGILFRRYYAIYRPKDELWLRAGRFYPAYGINTSEHELLIRKSLNFENMAEANETYNLEASYYGKKITVQGTYILGRTKTDQITGAKVKLEKGFSLVPSYYFQKTFRTGLSYYYGSTDDSSRSLIGPYAYLGFTHKFFVLAEADFQLRSVTGSAFTRGMADYVRADYEFIQGFHAYFVQQLARLNFQSSATLAQAYSLGLQIFPRPHFELQGEWLHAIVGSQKQIENDYYLMMHFYL